MILRQCSRFSVLFLVVSQLQRCELPFDRLAFFEHDRTRDELA